MLSGREAGLSWPVPAATWGLIDYVNVLSRVMEGISTSGEHLFSRAPNPLNSTNSTNDSLMISRIAAAL